MFAIVGLGFAIAGAVGTAGVRYLSPAPLISSAFGFGAAAMVGYVIAGLSWSSVGALLVVRRPGNAVGWFMVLVGVGFSLSQLSIALTSAFAAEGTTQGHRLAQIAGWATVLLQLVGVLQIAIGFIYPTGRAQSRAWGRFMVLFWAFAVLFIVISLTQPGPLQLIPALDNPFGFGPDLRGDRPMAPILVMLTLVIFASLGTSMALRYRSAGLIEQRQMKWFALALGLTAIGLGVTTSEVLLPDRSTEGIGLTVYVFAGAVVPIAIGIAILRHHLYDIDRLISRTVSWTVVSSVLVIIFAVAVVALQTILARFTQGQTLAVAGSTLMAFAFFQPVRRYVQSVVDRRFNRTRYDAERTVEGFAAGLRDELDLERVTGELGAVVGRACAPTAVSVWLRSSLRVRAR